MKYITGVNRSQITLMPGCLDDYVGEDNAARVIDAFVNLVDLAGKCTKAGKRRIYRLKNQDALERNNARMKTEEGKEKYRERSQTIEHVFGTIKSVWGYRQFLCRTQERTTTEQSLAFLAYNLRRAVNIFGQNGKNLVKAISI